MANLAAKRLEIDITPYSKSNGKFLRYHIKLKVQGIIRLKKGVFVSSGATQWAGTTIWKLTLAVEIIRKSIQHA